MPIGRLRASMTVLSVSLMALTVALLFWLGQTRQTSVQPRRVQAEPAQQPVTGPVLSMGLIPERDVFDQRRRYRALADYLTAELDLTVTLVTSNTYHGALSDMAEGRINCAFMGSMVATLAIDQLNARVLVKPEEMPGVTTYRGVIFVRDDSPIRDLQDLSGRSLAMVRTTMAGHLFPIYALTQNGLLEHQPPVLVRWVGTHDRVIEDVYSGEADAGAAKDLRIDAFERTHAGPRFRRLAVSEPAPNNALIVSRDLDPKLVADLESVLLAMGETDHGREVLDTFGALRFVSCQAREYRAVYDMAESLGQGWGLIGVGTDSAALARPGSTK